MGTQPQASQGAFTAWLSGNLPPAAALPPRPVKVTPYTFRQAITDEMMGYTREKLEAIYIELLALPYGGDDDPRSAPTKRSFIEQYTYPMTLPQMAHLARRIITEIDDAPTLQAMLDVYVADGGVAGTPKNLIFAATGPKPELVFTDAIDNNIAITKHAKHCLVYDRPIIGAGLTYADLVAWWRDLHPDCQRSRYSPGLNSRYSLGRGRWCCSTGSGRVVSSRRAGVACGVGSWVRRRVGRGWC
jgi:hypothetical protein